MSEYLISVLLGIVEGITEFLPVSSTAHLRVAESLLGIPLEDGYWKTYSVAVQLGAVLCLPVYFRARIISFIKSFLAAGDKRRHPIVLIAAAFVATAIPSYLLLQQIGDNLESLKIMAIALIGGGIVMGAVDLVKSKERHIRTKVMEEMTLKQAVVIGLCQVFAAVFPGLSRSMATIAGGQLMGLSRAAALEFSFFLSMPTMAAATGVTMLKSFGGGHALALTVQQWGVLAVGFIVSFIVAYASVAFLMHWVKARGFMPFAIYRVVAGLAILVFMV